MIHLGDITKIHGGTAPVVDVVIGGSPCQDLSIAGKRAGLAGERSGLYMEQIRVIKEMREHDRANGRSGEFIRPRYMVWENVPGSFNCNGGKDFGAVLEEAVRIVEPEAPPVPVPEKGWATSGCLMGDGWSVAWRVLDAQFWGVPQRRRRIALVADFGGKSAPEILFVRKSLSGDSEPGGTAREGLAGSTKESPGSPVWCLQGNGIDRADTAGCNGKGWKEGKCYTLNTIDRPAVCSLDMAHACDVVRDHGGISPSLQARMGTGGTLRAQEHGHQPLVTVFDPAQITSPVNRSRPEPGKPCHTLTSRMGTGGGNVPIMFRQQRFGSYDRDNVAGTCKARDGKDGTANLVCAVDCRHGIENPDTSETGWTARERNGKPPILPGTKPWATPLPFHPGNGC